MHAWDRKYFENLTKKNQIYSLFIYFIPASSVFLLHLPGMQKGILCFPLFLFSVVDDTRNQ